MKKKIKISLIVVVVLVGVILVDTLQARVLKTSPLISWKENLSDNDSWVDKGILMDTYYCTKEKDIVTVSWHFKTSKFTCPIDNVDELNEIEGVSMVIKDGTLTRTGATIVITDISGRDNAYGSEYRIDKNSRGEWKELDVVVEGEYGWNSIGYLVGEDGKLELKVNWEWLYGKLKNGEYRIVKSINNKYFSAEFRID